jgi:hypothetical protein
MCMCVCECVYVCICVYVYMCICVHMCVYVHMCAYVCMCVYVCNIILAKDIWKLLYRKECLKIYILTNDIIKMEDKNNSVLLK